VRVSLPGRLARALVPAAAAGLAGAATYRAVVAGDLTLDTGRGRVVRPLGPFTVDVAAPRERVFEVIAAPYLGRTPRAMQDRLEVLERGSDMVLAAHHTPLGGGRVATTVETVRFAHPERVDFRVVRGPVPYVVEHFLLHETPAGTALEYGGELGADFGPVGRWWGDKVSATWERVVRATFASVKEEAERRTR
jgi:hypothetical protein